MNKSLKLPLQNPFTVTFPKDANAVSILLNHQKAYSWLMNCFIQLTCWGKQYLDYYDFHYRNCPLLLCQRIKAEMVGQMDGGLITFIRMALEKGYYIVLPVETEYISQYDVKLVHDMMVYGYEDETLFHIADNFSDGKYRTAFCSTEELKRAISRIGDPATWGLGFEGTIELLSYGDEDRIGFELCRVLESFQDYLESKATSRWYVNPDVKWDADENRNRCFGMQCYEGIHKNIRIAKEQGYFDESGHRALFLEQEHKKIMEMRLQWMKDKYPISDEVVMEYHKIADMGRIAMNLKLKYDITKKEGLLDKIEEYYQRIQEMERYILPRIIHELECC